MVHPPVSIPTVVRAERPLNVVFAHDPRSRACDMLVERVVVAAAPFVAGCSVEEVGSLEAAWVALDRARRGSESTLVLSCLDLLPAPRAGATVAEWARSLGLPAVTVAIGRRWIPVGRGGVALLPSLSPLADRAEIERVVRSVLAPGAIGDALEGFEAPPESFPGRPSWLG